jgi:hypothetical protein
MGHFHTSSRRAQLRSQLALGHPFPNLGNKSVTHASSLAWNVLKVRRGDSEGRLVNIFQMFTPGFRKK